MDNRREDMKWLVQKLDQVSHLFLFHTETVFVRFHIKFHNRVK